MSAAVASPRSPICSRDNTHVRDTEPPPFTLPPMDPLPSVHTLGRRIAALTEATNRTDVRRIDDTGFKWAIDQEQALIDLVTTMPAVTLADAATQLWIAFRVADNVSDDMEAADAQDVSQKMVRLVRSVLPIVCEAAGIDLIKLGNGAAELCERHFPERGRTALGGGRV